MAPTKLNLISATLIGVGAIVGGGIFVLGGVAIREAGSFAALAFLLNGILVALTIKSTAYISKLFPESGGAYIYAKRILSVKAAFVVGWLLWFAHIVAALLYALGFAVYLRTTFLEFSFLHNLASFSLFNSVAAALAISFFTAFSLYRMRSDGKLLNPLKVILFAALLVAALYFGSATGSELSAVPDPFQLQISGLLAAMGFTFIALQGFELIAASSGDIERAEVTVPKAMYLALVISLVLYIPLLLLAVHYGIPAGENPSTWCAKNVDTCLVDAFQNIIGRAGYWLIIVIAMVGMLSALHANIIAAARTSYVMAVDRTLPATFAYLSERFKTPEASLLFNLTLLIVLTITVPDASKAGSAASLAFLVCFACTHLLCFLAVRRAPSGEDNKQRTISTITALLGFIACIALSSFQMYTDPLGAKLLLSWILFGGILFYRFLSRRAEVLDAFLQANTPELFTYRGESPNLLVPITSPSQIHARIQVAATFSPPGHGQLLVLSVASGDSSKSISEKLELASNVVTQSLEEAHRQGFRHVSGVVSIENDIWQGIQKAAKTHSCRTILFGFGGENSVLTPSQIERILRDTPMEIIIMHSKENWDLDKVERILVPVSEAGLHDIFRAKTLGRFLAARKHEVTFLRVVSEQVSPSSLLRLKSALANRINEQTRGRANVEVIPAQDVVEAIVENITPQTLTILGLSNDRSSPRLLSSFANEVVTRSSGATIFIRTP